MKIRLRQIAWVWGASMALVAGLLMTLPYSKAKAGNERFSGTTTTTHTVYLPLVSKSYEWHKVGGAIVTETTLKATQVFTGFQNYWYYTWATACGDLLDPSGHLGRHIPMVRPYNFSTFLSVTQYGPCNDGRPVLVLNEPEVRDQDNLSPVQALYIITSVVKSTWKGPVYIGGVIINNEQYISDVLTLWANAHGGSRLIPGVTGFHAHTYLNFVGNYSPWLTATQFMPLVDQNVQMVRDFVARRKAEGYSGVVIISEFGWLGRTLSLGRRDSDMAAIFDRYVQGFDTISEILGWAWFSDFCQTSPNPNEFDLSNLIFANGTLTPTGVKFREKLGLYP